MVDMPLFLLFTLQSPSVKKKKKKKREKKDGNFSNIFLKAQSKLELAMKPQRSSFLILTLMSHWRAWQEARRSLGPSCTFWCFVSNRAAFVQLSEREGLAARRSVFSNHKHTACVYFSFKFFFTKVIKTQLHVFHTATWASSIKNVRNRARVCVRVCTLISNR